MSHRILAHSSLYVPDSPSWQSEPDYSSEVAHALVTALAYARSQNFLLAYSSIQPCVARPMSLRQRLAVAYLLALAHYSVADNALALACLDEAIELALDLSNLDALMELFYLHGAANRAISNFPDALRDFNQCLGVLRSDDDTSRSQDLDLDLELGTLMSIAALELLLAQYQQCSDHLDEARVLCARAPDNAYDLAMVAWIAAALERWRGQPERALRTAMTACDVFVQAAPASSGRIQTLIADIALDLAQGQAPPGAAHARIAFLNLARPYAKRAFDLAKSASDKAGVAMAQLTNARIRRLEEKQESRTAVIEQVMRYARGNGDVALLCQAYTALGDEFAARGEHEPARNVYRAALSVADGCSVTAYGIWSRRNLLQLSEFDV